MSLQKAPFTVIGKHERIKPVVPKLRTVQSWNALQPLKESELLIHYTRLKMTEECVKHGPGRDAPNLKLQGIDRFIKFVEDPFPGITYMYPLNT